MATNKLLTVDISQVEALAARFKRLSGAEIASANVAAINQVADWAYDLGRDRITVGINLSDDYLRRRMRVDKATDARPQATITAAGGRADMTRLVHYDAEMVVVPKKTTRARGRGALSIPPGQKQRAVSVEVSRGGNTTLLYAFMLPLRRGTQAGGNGLGVFTRSRDGRLKQRYGPSVYQLFRHQLGTDYTGTVEEQLAGSLADLAQQAVENILK